MKVAQEVAPELIQKILIAGNQTSADQIAKGAGKGEIKSVIFLLAHKSASPSPPENGDDLLADVLRLADRIGAGVRVEPAKRWVSKRSPANHKSVIGVAWSVNPTMTVQTSHWSVDHSPSTRRRCSSRISSAMLVRAHWLSLKLPLSQRAVWLFTFGSGFDIVPPQLPNIESHYAASRFYPNSASAKVIVAHRDIIWKALRQGRTF